MHFARDALFYANLKAKARVFGSGLAKEEKRVSQLDLRD
jgi:hypothetical protein